VKVGLPRRPPQKWPCVWPFVAAGRPASLPTLLPRTTRQPGSRCLLPTARCQLPA